MQLDRSAYTGRAWPAHGSHFPGPAVAADVCWQWSRPANECARCEPSRLANEPALRRARAVAGPHALNLGPVAAHGLCLGYESRCPAAPTPFLAGSRLSRT